jgi:hypothetical protein
MFEQRLQTIINECVGLEGRDKLVEDMERAIGTLKSQEAAEQREHAHTD